MIVYLNGLIVLVCERLERCLPVFKTTHDR